MSEKSAEKDLTAEQKKALLNLWKRSKAWDKALNTRGSDGQEQCDRFWEAVDRCYIAFYQKNPNGGQDGRSTG